MKNSLKTLLLVKWWREWFILFSYFHLCVFKFILLVFLVTYKHGCDGIYHVSCYHFRQKKLKRMEMLERKAFLLLILLLLPPRAHSEEEEREDTCMHIDYVEKNVNLYDIPCSNSTSCSRPFNMTYIHIPPYVHNTYNETFWGVDEVLQCVISYREISAYKNFRRSNVSFRLFRPPKFCPIR